MSTINTMIDDEEKQSRKELEKLGFVNFKQGDQGHSHRRCKALKGTES